jgi:hypothetical protein
LGTVLHNNIPEFRSRVDSAMGIWVEEDFSLENVNTSSFVLYNNYHIAMENFKANPIAGSGIGSHSLAFDKYSLTLRSGILDIEFNKSDANSMFLRLLSETGLIGILFIFIFIFKYFVNRSRSHPESRHWIVGNAVLVIFHQRISTFYVVVLL